MPHSVSFHDPPSPSRSPDTLAADAEVAKGNSQDAMTEDTKRENVDSQSSDSTDQDIAMADAGVQGQEIREIVIKTEVKLEDIFADVESDDEFPSSTGQDMKDSSSPEAPASPV